MSELTKAAGADFVKTSTGFAGGGATAEDVKLMKDTVGADVEVKASGGVRNLTKISIKWLKQVRHVLVRAQAFKLCKV